jgi:hypothetical protein
MGALTQKTPWLRDTANGSEVDQTFLAASPKQIGKLLLRQDAPLQRSQARIRETLFAST